jgi:choice-of-anchor A domain-containing protein
LIINILFVFSFVLILYFMLKRLDNAISYFNTQYKSLCIVAALLCLNYSTVQSQVFGAASDYNLFSRNNTGLNYSDVEGRAAIGGNATIQDGYSIGMAMSPSASRYDLVVGGNLSTQWNMVMERGSIRYAGTYTQAQNAITFGTSGATISQGALPVDFNATQTILTTRSTYFNSLTANGTITNTGGILTLTGTSSTVNIFTLSSLPNSITTIRYNVPFGSTVIVNVAGTNIAVNSANANTANFEYWNGGSFVAIPDAYSNRSIRQYVQKVVWNFPSATSMTLQNVGFKGTVLAPNAGLSAGSGHVDGHLFVNSMQQVGGGNSDFQINWFPFDGNLPSGSCGTIVTVASNTPVCTATPINLTSTPSITSTEVFEQFVNYGNFIQWWGGAWWTDHPGTRDVKLTADQALSGRPACSGYNPKDPVFWVDGGNNALVNTWQVDLDVTSGTTYTLSFDAKDLYGGTSAAQPRWFVGGTAVGTASNLTTGGCAAAWATNSTTWTATSTGTVKFSIRNAQTSTAANANDFGIDNVSISTSVTPTNVYSWSGPNSFNSSTQNPTISSAILANAGTYTLTLTNGNCTGTNTTAVAVNACVVCSNVTAAGSIGTNQSSCTSSYDPINLTETVAPSGGSGGFEYQWQISSDNVTWADIASATAQTYDPPSISSTKYYRRGVRRVGCPTYLYSGVVTVSINASVTITASNTGAYCEGATIALNSTPSAGMGTVNWTGPSSFLTSGQNVIRSAAVVAHAGTYIANYTAPNGCTSTASTTVIINAATVGGTTSPSTQTICTNQGYIPTAITLSGHTGTIVRWEYATPGGGWNDWGGGGSTTAPGTCCFTSVGTWRVRAIIQSGVCASTASSEANIIVVNDPSISTSGGGSICSGGNLNLTATAANGTGTCTIQWQISSDNITFTNIAGANVSTYNTGSLSATRYYRAIYSCTGSNCDAATSNVQTVTVNAIPTATAIGSTTCVGGTVTLMSSGGSTYSWSGPASFTSSAQNPTRASATLSMAGTYTVTVTNASGCTATASANVVVPTLSMTNSVSSCINHPLQDVANVSVTITWANAPSGDDIKVTINNKTEYISVSSGLTSPQTIVFMVPANGTSNNNITASWVNATGCSITSTFNAPAACSSDVLCEKVLYLCGPDKPADGDAWDHGFMDYLTAVGVTAMTPAYTQPDATGYGLYNPMSIGTPLSVNLNDYTMVVISPTTESSLSADLITALKGYAGGILMMNYTQVDDLGMTNGNASYSFQNNAFINNTSQINIYNYDNINPNFGLVQTFGTYYANADAYLWINSNNMSAGINGIYFNYTASDVLTGVPSTHGARTYLGYHMNGLYSNAQNGGAVPAPTSSYFTPTKHLTIEAKVLLDNAIKSAATGVLVTATGDTKCEGATINLTATGTGISTYAWSGPASFSSTLQNPTRSGATAAMAGTYTVTVTSSNGCTKTATATVVVNTCNLPPVITNFLSATTARTTFRHLGTGTVVDYDATDPNIGQVLIFSITGGPDAARLSINSSNGFLTFNTPPNFDAPIDSDANNSYIVEITVTDPFGLTDVQLLTITITKFQPRLRTSQQVNYLSGLEFSRGKLWGIMDQGGLPHIYSIDTITGNILQTITIGGATNVDWEDLACDEWHLYIGDFGNDANGARTNLRIYKIDLDDIPTSGDGTIPAANVGIINFTYEDQPQPPTAVAANRTAFDCEAMLIRNGVLHLFTKDWTSVGTGYSSKQYLLPSIPGTFQAKYYGVMNNLGGHITAVDNAGPKQVLFVGRDTSNVGNTYSWTVHNFTGDAITSTGTLTKHVTGTVLENGSIEAISFGDTNRRGFTGSKTISITWNGSGPVSPAVLTTPQLFLYNTSQVIPQSALDGTAGEGSAQGLMRYNNPRNRPEYFDGLYWRPLVRQ